MTSDIALASPQGEQQPAVVQTAELPRVWPAVVLVGLFWSYDLVLRWLEAAMFTRFMSLLAAVALMTILFTVWWLTNRRIARADRWACFGFAILGGVVSAL